MNKIPTFINEQEEFEFWTKTDSTQFINWNNAKQVLFPNLKKTSREVTFNIPIDLFEKIKIRANKIDVPFESLIKMYILYSMTSFTKK